MRRGSWLHAIRNPARSATSRESRERRSHDSHRDSRRDSQLDVGIIGAGPGGLSLAHALLNRGYTVRIFERRKAFAPVGAAIFMHPFALNALRGISPKLEEQLRTAATEIKTLSVGSLADADFGFSLGGLERAKEVFGSPFVAIRFWDMLKALRQGLPEDIFHFGQELSGFEQLEDGGVRLLFESGDECTVGMLVDAGGIRSKTRQQLIGDRPIPRVRATYAVAPGSALVQSVGAKANGDAELAFLFSDGCGLTTASLKDESVWWTQTCFGDSPTAALAADQGSLVKQLDARYASWPARVKGLLRATPAEEIIESTLAELPISTQWGQGNVTLLGDAAHAQLPSLGLGVSTAFGDVEELARQIDNHGLTPAALRWYEAWRLPHTAALQLLSRGIFFLALLTASLKPKDDGSEKGGPSPLPPSPPPGPKPPTRPI